MKVAFDNRWVPLLQDTLRRESAIGVEAHSVEGTALRQEFADNPCFYGAIYEPNVAIIHPCKHVRELKRLAVAAGSRCTKEPPAFISAKPRMGSESLRRADRSTQRSSYWRPMRIPTSFYRSHRKSAQAGSGPNDRPSRCYRATYAGSVETNRLAARLCAHQLASADASDDATIRWADFV